MEVGYKCLMLSETNTNEANQEELSEPAVRNQVNHILASSGFAASVRLQELLTYVVNETLEGRADRVKGVTIVQDVFGQTNPEAAQSSTVASVEAGRLRRKLSDYYLNEGSDAPIYISIPKGTFVPIFRRNNVPLDLPVSESAAVQSRMPGNRGFSIYAALAFLTVLIVLALLFWPRDELQSLDTTDSVSRPAIAVIPFRNATGFQVNKRLATGLTQDIITDLARSSGIDVISYSSVSLLANSDMLPSKIAEVLNVTHILQGSLRGELPHIRVNAELLDATSGKVIWANRFDHSATNPLAIQDSIASRVISDMAPDLRDWPIGRQTSTPSTSIDTKALFEQAVTLVNPPSDASRLNVAQLAFESVIAADPDFAGGHAGVAYVRAFKALWGHVPDVFDEARKSAELASTALEIDPSSGLALEAMALAKLVERDFDSAVDASEQALLSAPNDPYAHSYHAFILTANGQPEKAVLFAKKAIRLDPMDPRTPYRNILSVVQIHAGNYEQALLALAANKEMGGPQTPGHSATEAAAYAMLGRPDEARRILKTLPPGFVGGPWLAWQKRSFRKPEDAERFPTLLLNLE